MVRLGWYQFAAVELRLASPVNLGYKQSKWVTQIVFLSQLVPKKGYWEDQGYEWFAGL